MTKIGTRPTNAIIRISINGDPYREITRPIIYESGTDGEIVASIELDFPIETTETPHEESLG